MHFTEHGWYSLKGLLQQHKIFKSKYRLPTKYWFYFIFFLKPKQQNMKN